MSQISRASSRGRRRGGHRDRAVDPAGFALVEVIVSALMVALISMLMVGLISAGKTSGDQRSRSQADELAQQDQERLRGMSLEQLAGLSQTRTVTLDSVPYTITSTGQFLSKSSNGSSCTSTGSDTADYVAVKSSVTWGSNVRTPIVEQSIIAPPVGGTLLTRVVDQSGNALSGARVTATAAASSSNSSAAATTDANGCTIFTALPVGDYNVGATKSGYVDKDGDATPSATATTTAGNTATANFTIGQAGAIAATFKTTISGTTYTGQLAPSLSYTNPQMATFGNYTPSAVATSITTPQVLFPFFTTAPTVFTNNYTAFAGKCSVNQPPSNATTATVPPGGTGAAAVLLPPVILKVNYRTVSTTTLVQPDHIVVFNGCNSSFGTVESWLEPVRGTGSAGSTDATGALGALSLPGLPYGPYYQVCVDDQGYRVFSGTLTNTNFSGTTWTVTIDSRFSTNRGVC